MYSKGFVKLRRSLPDWEWYSDTNTVRLFVHILLRVHFSETVWKGVVIGRGSMVTSVQSLSQETGLSVQQTRSALRHLLDSGQITCETTNRYSVLTVVNYDDFRYRNEQDNKPRNMPVNKPDNMRATSRPTTEKENKEEKKRKKNILLSAEADAKMRQRCDCAEIVDCFNRICVSLPQVRTLSDKRRKAIRAASGTVEDCGGWEKLFEAVEQSDFLTGRSGTWNGCGFDWILKPANLVKILEGNYADKNARKEKTYDESLRIATTV